MGIEERERKAGETSGGIAVSLTPAESAFLNPSPQAARWAASALQEDLGEAPASIAVRLSAERLADLWFERASVDGRLVLISEQQAYLVERLGAFERAARDAGQALPIGLARGAPPEDPAFSRRAHPLLRALRSSNLILARALEPHRRWESLEAAGEGERSGRQSPSANALMACCEAPKEEGQNPQSGALRAQIAQALLAAGLDPNQANSSSITPLMMASAKGASALIAPLVAAGAELGARDDDGNTALHWAASENQTESALELLRAGADPRAQNDYCQSALNKAYGKGAPSALAQALKAAAEALDLKAMMEPEARAPSAKRARAL